MGQGFSRCKMCGNWQPWRVIPPKRVAPSKRGRRCRRSSDETSTNFCSCTSRIRQHPGNFMWIHGRQYRNVDRPEAEPELDSLDHECFLWKAVFGDCASDTWTMEMAKLYPHCELIGINISSTIPSDTDSRNIVYADSGICDGLPFEDESFDFVMMRTMTLALRRKEWPVIMKEIFRVTKQNGVVQLLEAVGRYVTTDPEAAEFTEKVLMALGAQGQDPLAGERLHRFLADSGFAVIQREKRSVPMGWNCKVDGIMLEDTLRVAMAAKPHLVSGFRGNGEKYENQIRDMLKRYQASNSYVNFYAAIGRKHIVV
ncbi:hypothetical protein BC938DRAFT_481441 [Jimgerdemannia flammicorona]|uniref:Methyltransferase domain-containing protein n=1 Tax=Jimgerdemannia flammicorona TaxID=994334 RepID=A0A433QG70_9FUNG|nr:hypothetical protein BC938DRAFT_481441 [Jimgerdemannia flammicorona]